MQNTRFCIYNPDRDYGDECTSWAALFDKTPNVTSDTRISYNDLQLFVKEKGIKGRINDLAEAFRELQFERVGEVKHKRTGRKPTLWLRDSFDFFCDKSMSSICNTYWMPMNIEEWNLSNGDVSMIQNAMKDLETYQDFIEGTPEEDPEEDFETIRRERAKRGAQ